MKRINLQHITCSPKYRRPVFVNQAVAKACERHIRHICKLKRINLMALAIEEDHAHIFINLPNTMSVSKAVFLIKWYSSRWLRIEFKQLKTYPKTTAFWQKRYWNKSVGGDMRTVREYIEKQGVKIDGEES